MTPQNADRDYVNAPYRDDDARLQLERMGFVVEQSDGHRCLMRQDFGANLGHPSIYLHRLFADRVVSRVQ